MEEEKKLDLDKVSDHIEQNMGDYIESFFDDHNLLDVDVEIHVSYINGFVSVNVETIEQTFN